MIAAAAVLLPLLVAGIWLFARRAGANQPVALRRFNVGVLVVAAGGIFAATLYAWRALGQTVDRAWWPVIAVLGSVLAVSMILIIGAGIRAVVFRRSAEE